MYNWIYYKWFLRKFQLSLPPKMSKFVKFFILLLTNIILIYAVNSYLEQHFAGSIFFADIFCKTIVKIKYIVTGNRMYTIYS